MPKRLPRNVRKGKAMSYLSRMYGKVYIMRRVVVMVLACVAAYMVRGVGPKVAMSLMGAHVSLPVLACVCVVAGVWVCAGVRK